MIDDFDAYSDDSSPRYYFDYGGSFQIASDPTAVANKVLKQWVQNQPAVNGWLPNCEPITLIGYQLCDVFVSVDFFLPKLQPMRPYTQVSSIQSAWSGLCLSIPGATWDGVPLAQGSCLASVDGQFKFDSKTGNIKSESMSHLCITANDCFDSLNPQTSLCLRQCRAYPDVRRQSNQSWIWGSDGSLRLQSDPGQCLTSTGTFNAGSYGADDMITPAVRLLQCDTPKPSSRQQWLGARSELTTYAGVCLRLTPGSRVPPLFHGRTDRPGYCLLLGTDDSGQGSWHLESGGDSASILARGVFPAALGVWHRLQLAVDGATIRLKVDDTDEFILVHSTHTKGAVALVSGWHVAHFDNFALAISSNLPSAVY